MCGIVGYIGKQKAAPILLEGLKRLEYRGYDSAGISIMEKAGVKNFKAVGKVVELEKEIFAQNFDGQIGIAHTRWATHGKPSKENAHPHGDCSGKIWIVHNGIIENYKELKRNLENKGHKFRSDTDSEVIAHLIEELGKKMDFKSSVRESLKLVQGTYGLAVINQNEPDKIVVAKKGSPLILGIGKNEYIIASDVSAIISHTDKVVYLEDEEMVVLDKDNYEISSIRGGVMDDKEISTIEWSMDQAEKGGFEHFMLKEIFDQPQSIKDAIRGRISADDGLVKLGGLKDVEKRLRDAEKITIVACGTARLAAMVGEYMLEEYAGIPVEVDYSHEFRYRKNIIDEKTILIAISQSGETADTLAAVKEAKEKGALTLGIVNAVGSSIARETDAGVYNHSGPEISVASTKAFTSQLSIMALLAVFMGRQRQMSLIMGQRILKELDDLPKKIEAILAQREEIEKIAKKYYEYPNFAFLGRKYNYPIAFEGAIKLKEISYIHAEGFAAAEMKHGPIAMIDENFPSVFIIPKDSVYDKTISAIEEIKARKGKVIAIATEGDEEVAKLVDEVIYVPKTLEMLSPILTVVPLQLFAYYAGVCKGYDVDKPRNLAKSVTVE